MTASKRLRYPVHFVCAESRIWPELREAVFRPATPERLAEICVDSLDCWVLRTAYELRKLGETVSISSRTIRDAINVGDIYEVGQRTRAGDEYIVIPRGDGHDPELANFTLLQNATSTSRRSSESIRMWLQPGIVPRESDRGESISVLAFKGADINLDAAFRSEEFKRALEAEGVVLRVDSGQGHLWADYRGVDLVLAVRNLTIYDAGRKPASKLINAWWADVPALLGPEVAFAELGQSHRDYIEVRTPGQVLEAIRAFRANPGSYTRMVESGRARRTEFTDGETAARWVDLLNGPIGEAFDRWRRGSWASRALQVALMRAKEPFSKRSHRAAVLDGPRLLQAPATTP